MRRIALCAALFAVLTLNGCVEPVFAVKYEGNGNTGGSVPVDSTEYLENDAVTVSDNTGALVKSNSVFSGWNSEADGSGTQYIPGEKFRITEDVTMYAVWNKVICTITYDANGATGGKVPAVQTAYDSGSMVTVLGNTGGLYKSGYIFSGWNSAASGLESKYAKGTSFLIGADVTLYAKWIKDSYAVGDTGPAGGVIFYVNPNSSIDGWRYLEAAPASTEWGYVHWGNTDDGPPADAIGAGKGNTASFVEILEADGLTGMGAQLCDSLVAGGEDDWFLPSLKELELMFNELYMKNRGGFVIGPYMSSTYIYPNFPTPYETRWIAYWEFEPGGLEMNGGEGYRFNARAIRMF